MSCARCGCGVYKTEEFIALNKVWHKQCFTCYRCEKRLDKNCAKVFQGELFCDCCYSGLVESIFEVISAPSINKPCKVVSTPSCTVSGAFVNCFKPCSGKINPCCKEYCFPAEKKSCIKRNAQSCSCIPIQKCKQNEYCFLFPIPREVANYYNRSHMNTKNCCPQKPTCTSCNCRKCPTPRCNIRPLCNSPKCRSCCPKPPPCPPIFSKNCGCCSPEPGCCRPCRPRQSCTPPCVPPSPCQGCQSCQPKSCQPVSNCCQPTKCCSPPKCSPPPKCCPKPGNCSPLKCCPPPKYCPVKIEGCPLPYSQLPSCRKSPRCCYRPPKSCVCGNLNPCGCKMSQILAQCTVCCNRCGQKVYVAEKVLVSSGAYHTSCFTCYCCNKCLDVKNVYEGKNEIFCKQCYNHFFGVQYYGFGRTDC